MKQHVGGGRQTQDVDAGGGDVDRSRTVVGEIRQRVVLCARRDADQIERCIRARVRRVAGTVHVDPGVPGSHDVQRVRMTVDGRLHSARCRRTSAAEVDHSDAHGAGVVECARDRGVGRASGCVEHAEADEADLPIDAGHRATVVASRADRAGDVGSVTHLHVVVTRVVVVVDEVPAVRIIDETVAVIVDVVGLLAATGLTRIRPEVAGKIGMVVIDARVDDRDDHARATGGDIPRFGSIDVGIQGPTGTEHRLAGVVQGPEVAETVVVGNRVGTVDVVRLDELHTRLAPQGVHRRRRRFAGCEFHQLRTRHTEVLCERHVGIVERVVHLGR